MKATLNVDNEGKTQTLNGQGKARLIHFFEHMPRQRTRGGAIACALFAATASLFAQSLTNSGGEYPILGGVPGDQVWPSVALSPSGGCIAWEDSRVKKGGDGIGAALLNTGFGAEPIFRVEQTLTGSYQRPQVALLADDKMIFVWHSHVAGTYDCYARLAKGTSGYGSNFYTADLRLNTRIADAQMNPSVAALPDGGAITTWQSYNQDGSMWGVFARKLTGAGKFATPREFQVNQFSAYNQKEPAVATLANGDFVIVWVSEQEKSATSVGVYGRIFTSAGVADATAQEGNEFEINTGTDVCGSPSVAPNSDGGFTVVWNQKDSVEPTNSWDIWGRQFSASGSPETAQSYRINTYLYGDQYAPKIASGPTGSMVVWTSMGQDGSQEGVYGRFLLGGGQPSGAEFRVNTTVASKQIHPAVAYDGVGRFLAVWTSFAGTSGFDLYGQAYSLGP